MTLRFDAASHTYHVGKRKVPGVTAALDPYNGLQHVDPDQLAAAAAFGTHVHEAINLYNRDALDHGMDDNELLYAYVAGWATFLEDSGFVVIYSEERVYHPKLGYAGTLDVIGQFPKHKELVLMDVKTGSTVPPTVGPQTAAYSEAWAAQRKKRRLRRYCCQIGPNKYNLAPLTDVRDFDIFKAALTLHRWQTGE